jgi:hypothetical protein
MAKKNGENTEATGATSNGEGTDGQDTVQNTAKEAALRDAVTALEVATERLFAPVTDEELTQVCKDYVDAVTAHEKACASI